MRLLAYLLTGHTQAPHEYLEHILMRDVYHCDPIALSRVPLSRQLIDLQILGIESKAKQHKQRAASSRNPKQ